MDLIKTDNISCCLFFYWHLQFRLNIDFSKKYASFHDPVFLFELDFFFIRFWFDIIKKIK